MKKESGRNYSGLDKKEDAGEELGAELDEGRDLSICRSKAKQEVKII